MKPTKLKYFEDSYLFEEEAKILKIDKNEESKAYILLDESIFYPQGGGQPYDIGNISNNLGKFNVNEVRFKDGFTFHFGNLEEGVLNENDIVHISINPERRKLNCKLHSAGHLIDNAIHDLEYELIPLKAYHFPDGPYVEFQGNINEDLQIAAKKIEDRINSYISDGFEVTSEFTELNLDTSKKVFFVPSHIPDNKPVRIVYVYGPIGEFCGGTHVKNIREIGRIKIPKIKYKAGITKISYQLD